MTQPKIAVVTGGAGFIGSHAVDRLLSEGYAVRVIDNLLGGRLENLEQHRNEPRLAVDTRDLRSIEPSDSLFQKANIVLHFAGIGDIVPSIDHPAEYFSVNVMGTIHALEASRYASIDKFVYAASSSCYGLADEIPTTENAPIQPKYPYALSKFAGEQAALHWGQVYKLPVNSIRIFNAYGPRSRTSGAYGAVFGVFLSQKLAGKPFTVVGDGTQRRDFVHVRDVARAFILAAQTKHSQRTYNLGAGHPRSVNELVRLLGGKIVRLPKRPGEPDVTWADTSRICEELGWSPSVMFEEGVAGMVDIIEAWRTAPVWDVDSIETATRTWFAMLSTDESL